MNVMRLFLVIVLTLSLSSCYETERNCNYFRTGTFEFQTAEGTELFSSRIIRNDSIEIEYFRGKVDTSSIRWINDCEYIVKKLNPHNRAEEKAIHIKILTTKGEDFIFEFSEVGKTNKRKATAKKIN